MFVARTARGRRSLASARVPALGSVRALPASFWFEREAGVAIAGPARFERRARNQEATLFVHGRPRDEEGRAADLTGIGDDGASAIARVRGDFALAHWDARRRRLVLARDHLGQRGLFVRREVDFYIVCSCLEPLLELGGCELDLESAWHYLSYGQPAPGRTLATRIDRVPAGHLLSWEPGGLPSLTRYWTPLRADAAVEDSPSWNGQFERALESSVRASLAVARGGGLLLSGGLDSSYLAAVATRQGMGNQLFGYTIEFSGKPGLNEGEFAEIIADRFGLRHRVVTIDADQALVRLGEVLAEPEPCAAAATIVHRHLQGAARDDGVQTLVSGLGSDEIFATYRRMLAHYFLMKELLVRSPSESPSELFRQAMLDPVAAERLLFPGVATFFTDAQRGELLHPKYASWNLASHRQAFYRECVRIKPEAHIFELMVAHECQHRIPDLLLAGFGTGGVEVSYPYLDPGVVELVTGLKASSRFQPRPDEQWLGKVPLRKIAARVLPRRILERPRMSYAAPFGQWLREPAFARPTLARLRKSALWKLGFLRRQWLAPAIQRTISEGTDHSSPEWLLDERQLWILLTLAAWFDRYVENTPS